jgi:hypothetical protein
MLVGLMYVLPDTKFNVKKLAVLKSIEAVLEAIVNALTSPAIEPVTVNEPVICAEPVNGKALPEPVILPETAGP